MFRENWAAVEAAPPVDRELFQASLDEAGIGYRHRRELAPPTDLRRDLEDLKRDYDTGELLRASSSGSRRFALLPERRGWVLPALAVAVVAARWATRSPCC